jgi:hypothetical protein
MKTNPFLDGNGRIHRLLIHDVLARAGFTPPGVLLPVSAVMLARRRDYDASLEAFSRPLMERLQYLESDEGEVTVTSESARWYRYPDLTAQAEALARWVDITIDEDLPAQLDFLVAYRAARDAMTAIVDMPNQKAELFVRLWLDQGRLSGAKRQSHFAELADDEVTRLEAVVAEHLGAHRPPPDPSRCE